MQLESEKKQIQVESALSKSYWQDCGFQTKKKVHQELAQLNEEKSTN